jgi:hypothetical protein
MILKSLKNSHSYLIVIFLIFSVIFFTLIFFTKEFQNIETNNVLYPSLILFSVFLITTFHCIGLNNLIYEKDVIKKPNFVVGMVYLLLTTPFINNLQMVIFSFGLLYFLYSLLEMFKKKKPFSLAFNSSIILSIISIFFPNILLLFPLIIIALIIFGNIDWRCFVISLVAIIVPYLFLWTYQSVTNDTLLMPNIELEFQFKLLKIPDFSISEILWFSVLGIIILRSVLELFLWMYKKSIRSRSSFFLISFYLLFSVLIFLFSKNSESVFLIICPLSIIISNFFVYFKYSKISEFLFLLLLFSSIFYRVSMI